MHYCGKFTNILTSEKNRAQSRLTISNLKLNGCESFDVAPFIGKRCKHTLDEIQPLLTAMSLPNKLSSHANA